MADEQKKNESEGLLVGAAKALGSAAGKVASLTTAAADKPEKAPAEKPAGAEKPAAAEKPAPAEKPAAEKPAAEKPADKPAPRAKKPKAEPPPKVALKEGTYDAQYLGSGTFIIRKPKRKEAKRRQSRLKGTVRGARK